MGPLRPSIRWVGALIERKLGVCPYCMRASALGSLIGWLLYAGSRVFSTAAWLQVLLLLGASAFAVLFSAHIVAYMVRVGLRLRDRNRILRTTQPATAHLLARREFLATVLRAGAYALTIALIPGVKAFAQAGNTCADMRPAGDKGNHDVTGDADSTIVVPAGANTWGTPRQAIEAQAIAAAKAKCEAKCRDGSCGASPPSCLPSGPAVYTVDCIAENPANPPGLGWKCTAKVKQCPCACYTCIEQKPPPPDDFGIGEGVGGNEIPNMQADADRKCQEFCQKIHCGGGKVCQSQGKTMDKHKRAPKPPPSGNNSARADIKACKCKCV